MHAEELRRFLSDAVGRPVRLRVNDNARNVVGVSPERPGPGLRVSIHRAFLNADESMMRTLAEFIAGPSEASRRAVRLYISTNRELFKGSPRRAELTPIGGHHDLAASAERIHHACFGGALQYTIGWMRPPRPRRSTMSHVTLGEWDIARREIRIHPMLDSPEVPSYYIDSVIHHEMVHIVVPSEVGCTGKLYHHTKGFRDAERRYEWHAVAAAWEKMHLSRVIAKWCRTQRGSARPRLFTAAMDIFGS